MRARFVVVGVDGVEQRLERCRDEALGTPAGGTVAMEEGAGDQTARQCPGGAGERSWGHAPALRKKCTEPPVIGETPD